MSEAKLGPSQGNMNGRTPDKLVAVLDSREPVRPQGVTDEEAQELKARAAHAVGLLGTASGSRELEVVDGIASVGIQAQRKAGQELDLLRTHVGAVLTKGGPGEAIAHELVDLRLALNRINPQKTRYSGLMQRIIGSIPFVGRSTTVIRTLERIAVRYEPVARQVELLESRLRDGRLMLVRDNVELRKLYEQVEAQQLPIQKNAYLGELVMRELNRLIDDTTDPGKVDRLRNALYDVSIRVQDLRTMEEVHTQFFVSIEMTRQNNTRLGQAVERTLTLGSNVVMIALAIHTALARQRRVLEATQRTREFLSNLIVANASAIKQHTAEIGDVYNSPVVALDKIMQAHDDLIEAINTADRLKQEGIESARENIAKLGQMARELEERSRGLRGIAEPASIEA